MSMGKTRALIPPTKVTRAGSAPVKTSQALHKESRKRLEVTSQERNLKQKADIAQRAGMRTEEPSTTSKCRDEDDLSGFFFIKNQDPADDVYQFLDSPKNSPVTEEKNMSKIKGKLTTKRIGKIKNSTKKEVLKGIRKMEREMAQLRQQEKFLLESNEL